MDPEKRKRLEAAGWVFGDAADFVGLRPTVAHPLEVGTRILSTRSVLCCPDDPKCPVRTGPNVVGVVESADEPIPTAPERGWCYQVRFVDETSGNPGVWACLDQFGDLDDPERFRILGSSEEVST